VLTRGRLFIRLFIRFVRPIELTDEQKPIKKLAHKVKKVAKNIVVHSAGMELVMEKEQ
jgi:hypothetical protein